MYQQNKLKIKIMYTISERLKLTLENIGHQQNRLFWDDLEKLEEVLNRVQELEKHFEDYQQITQRLAEENETLEARILNLKHGIEIKTNK